ncbi:hypothetical protein [Nonomuraea sp. NPDC049684]|uniref:hypothetical protein n=1 Tax=Nonomuraea sp. NPDC049684 TaxID=3364356 RepID=UPI0037B52BF1
MATLAPQGRAVGVGAMAAKHKERSAFPTCTSTILGTGNTIAAGSGASLKDLMQRMGRNSVRAALIYQHSTAEADRKITDIMNAKIERASAPATDTSTARSPVSVIGNGALQAGGRYWVRTSAPSLVRLAATRWDLG